jgi:hypothetical protein
VYEADKTTPVHREDRKLERRARIRPGADDLSDHFVGTASETSELFDSEYKPSSEWGEDPRQE